MEDIGPEKLMTNLGGSGLAFITLALFPLRKFFKAGIKIKDDLKQGIVAQCYREVLVGSLQPMRNFSVVPWPSSLDQPPRIL